MSNSIYCPKCAMRNPQTASACESCGYVFPPLPLPPPDTFGVLERFEDKQRLDKVKFSTVVLLIVGLLLPLWPVSLPLCWWLAYVSYKKPWSF